MKKILSILKPVLLISAAAIFITCGKKSSGDYRNLIPQSAAITISVNPDALMEKAGFSKAERAAYRTQAEMMFAFAGGMFSAEDQKFILSIIESPDNSGLSFKDDMYIFLGGENMAISPDVGFVAKVGNRKKLDDLIAIFTKLSPELAVSNQGGIRVLTVDQSQGNTVLLAYDDNSCLVYRSGYDYAATLSGITNLFRDGNGGALLSDRKFSPFVDGKSDMGLLMSYEAITKIAQSDGRPVPMADLLSSVHVYMGTKFNKGSIDTDYGLIFRDEQARRDFEEVNKPSPVEGRFADIIPNDVLVAMSGNVDGPAVFNILSKVPEYAFLGMVPEVENIIAKLKGDVVLALTGIDIAGREFTGFLAATVSDVEVLDYIVDQGGRFIDIRPAGERSYTADLGFFPLSFGVHDNVLYFTNDAVMVEALKGSRVNQLDNKVKGHFKNGYGAVYINVNRLAAIISEAASAGYSEPATMRLIHFFSSFEDMVIYADKPYEGKMIVNMVDKKENSLASITNVIKDIAMGSLGGMMF